MEGGMGELSKNVGAGIKKIREARKIKQFELAEKLNMEPSNLTRIESGYQFPKEENLQKIADKLEVQVKDLFDFSKNNSRDELKSEIISYTEQFSTKELKFLCELIKLYGLNR